ESSGLLQALEEDSPEGRAEAVAPRPGPGLGAAAARFLEPLGPELAPFAESLAPLAERERVVCAVPFALTVR
ncbi:MAG TPA: hypothetical protein VHS09_03185, partial [Polyangiaceae bacterium]|nr:hypothetical protein [Polyangiaceae bacterium]